MPGHLSNVVSLVVQELFKPVYFVWLIISSSYVYVNVYDFLHLERMNSLVKIYFYIRLYECRRFLVSNTGICEIVFSHMQGER